MGALRWILVVQLAFFGAWGASLLGSHRVAETVWLETTPVDPRDLLSGHYVDLAYPISADAVRLCAKEGEANTVYLRLQPTPEPIGTFEGPAQVSRATECRGAPPDSGSGTWIVGHRAQGPRVADVEFGIGRFYVPEASILRTASSGEVVAKIVINDHHEPRIVDLVATVPQPFAP